MTALNWVSGDRPYEAGVERGVLYLPDVPGVAWDGLVSVEEKNDLATRVQYVDGKALGIVQTSEDFALVLSAFMYPDEFETYTGYDDSYTSEADIYTKYPRRRFGLSYRVGDAETGKIHLIYNATAIPSDFEWKTLAKASDITTFKWDISTVPFEYSGIRPTAHIIIDIASAHAGVVDDLSDILYGTSTSTPRLPTLSEIVDVFEFYATFRVIDNGDGTWTATGPDSYISYIDATSFTITSPTAVLLDATSYTLSSDY